MNLPKHHPKGQFLGHEECPQCKASGRDSSGDNLARYEFNVFCLACGYHAFTDSAFYTPKELRIKDMKPLPEQATHSIDDWASKGIHGNTLNTFGVEFVSKVSKSNVTILDEDARPISDGRIRFPYYDISNGKLIGFKYRNIEQELDTGKKAIKTLNGEHFSVFGFQVKGTNKILIITEGETDTLAWKQALPECTVWGIPGAQHVERSLTRVMEKALLNYDKIILAFDNDEAGRAGLDVALSMLPPIKTYTIEYPTGCKDACDVLKSSGAKGLKEVVKNATQVKPADIIGDEELIERAMHLSENVDSLFGGTTGYPELDNIVGGWTPGKVLMLAGDSGTGKTSFSLQLVHKLIQNGKNIFFIPLEMTPEQVMLKLVEMELKQAVISDPNAVQPSREKKLAAMKRITQHVKFLNKFGALNSEYLTQQVEVAVHAYKSDVIVLDHITAATTANGGGWGEIDQMIYALKACALQHRIAILVVSHINKMGQAKRPSADMLRGSAALKQAVDVVLLIHRDYKKEVTEIWTGKVDRFIGKMGKILFVFQNFEFVVYEGDGDLESDDDGEDDIDLEMRKPKEFYRDGKKEAAEYFSTKRGNGNKIPVEVRDGHSSHEPGSTVRARKAGVRRTS